MENREESKKIGVPESTPDFMSQNSKCKIQYFKRTNIQELCISICFFV